MIIEHGCHSNTVIAMLAASYLLGSIPFGMVITKFSGFGDIRKFGSGNIGATNVLRKAGKFWGFMTLLLDGGKGALAIYLTQHICHDQLMILATGLAVILGHIFSIWLWFKGGKGVATALAVFFMLNLHFGLFTCAIWLVAFSLTRIVSLASILAFVLAPMMAYLIGTQDLAGLCISIISLLVIVRHKENIKRLMDKAEKKI